MHTNDALVSICVPTFNGATLIERALDSALAQSYGRLEIVVVDDSSSDGTPELVRERYGGQVQLVVNGRQQGLSRNHNVAIRQCRGEFIKFLHQDDTLEPECVAKMSEAMSRHRTVGLVFARRVVETPQAARKEPPGPDHREPHEHFLELRSISDGSALLTDWLARGFPDNWIGEPTAVMVSRKALKSAGLFSSDVRQGMDIDLWMRILATGFDAAFIDEELATFRLSRESATARTVSRYTHWLDSLWILEHLSAGGAIAQYPMLKSMRRRHRRIAFRSATRSAVARGRSYPIRLYWPYLLYRMHIKRLNTTRLQTCADEPT